MTERSSLLVTSSPPAKKSDHEGSENGIDKKLLAFVCIGGLTLLYVLGELGVALYVDSLVLLSDGFHNLGDVVALYIAFWSQRAKKRAFSDSMSYGWARTEILGGLTNGMFLISLSLYVVLESITKFIKPDRLDSGWLFVITAGAGLVINFIGTVVFLVSGQSHGHSHSHGHDHGHSHGNKKKNKDNIKQQYQTINEPNEPFSDNEEKHIMSSYQSPDIEVVEESHSHSHSHDHKEGKDKKKKHSHEHGHSHSHKKDKKKKKKHAEDLNLKAVFLHYLGDTISSLLVLGAGLILHFFPDSKFSLYIDPISSLAIVVLILFTTVPLVKRCAMILLQSTPSHIDQDSLRSEIMKLPGLVNVHDFHMWQLVDGMTITSVHIAVEEGCEFTNIVARIKEIFHEHGIHSSAIQPEFVPANHNAPPVCEQNCVDECEEDWCCKNALKNRKKASV